MECMSSDGRTPAESDRGSPGRVRAVVFDVYQTLLQVEDTDGNPLLPWKALWSQYLPGRTCPDLESFDHRCRQLVQQWNDKAREEGRRWPEVDWEALAVAAEPDLLNLCPDSLRSFLTVHAGLRRSTTAMPGAVEFISKLRAGGIPLGIASNAQHYTRSELEAAGISLSWFNPEFCFWSGNEGFSKPDPAVFLRLGQRFKDAGIKPGEILMIGDRPENDLAPAAAAGWQTWHFRGYWPPHSWFPG